jgi:hypothetical protein
MGKIFFTCRLYGKRHVCSRNREHYLLSIGFPRVKIRNLIAFKIIKARQWLVVWKTTRRWLPMSGCQILKRSVNQELIFIRLSKRYSQLNNQITCYMQMTEFVILIAIFWLCQQHKKLYLIFANSDLFLVIMLPS